jgi:thioredoxin 1
MQRVFAEGGRSFLLMRNKPMDFAEFQSRLQASKHPVIVDLWAPWCGPCRMLSPRLDQVGNTFARQVEVWKVNVDESPEVARSLGVMGIPTLVAYKDGKEVMRRTGVQSIPALEQLFTALIGEDSVAPVNAMSDATRWLRVLSGLALWVMAAFSSWSPILLLTGGAILFSGVYDRCPIWRAVTRQFSRKASPQNSQQETAS